MKIRAIALFLVMLIVNSNFIYAIGISDAVDTNTKNFFVDSVEATDIIINVDSYYPLVLSEQAFESDQAGGYSIFATLTGMKTNPLMDLEKIRSMRVNAVGASTKYVRGVYYKPPQSGYFNLDNLGYMVIRLENLKEDEVPDQLDLNLTATIVYEIQNGFGIGEQDLVLPLLTEDEFFLEKSKYSFWSGRGAVRLANVNGNTANMIVYDGRLNKNTVSVSEGKESPKRYLTGGTSYLLYNDEVGRNSRDTYKIRVNQIVGNKDVAGVEMNFNGQYKLKKLVEGQFLYSGSNWKIKKVTASDSTDKVELYNDITNERLILEGGRYYIPPAEEKVTGYTFKSGEVEYGDQISGYANEYGLSPALIAGVIKQESDFNPNAIGDNGNSVGLMQISKGTANDLKLNVYSEDIKNIKDEDGRFILDERFNPDKNIEAGTRYLSQQIKKFGSEKLGLAAYNWGTGNVENMLRHCNNYGDCKTKGKILTSVVSYVDNVLKKKEEYETKLISISEVSSNKISEDEKTKELDKTYNGEFQSIKKDINLLPPSAEMSNIIAKLEEYKTLLNEINNADESSNKVLTNKYRALMIDHIFSDDFSDKFSTDVWIEVGNYISKEFRELLNDFAEPVSKEENKDAFNLISSDYYYDLAIEHYKTVFDQYTDAEDPLNKNKIIARDAQLKIAKIYDFNLRDYTKAAEEYKTFLAKYPSDEEREYVEKRIEFLELVRFYESNTINIFENGNTIQLNLYGIEKASKNDKATINVNNEGSKEYSVDYGRNRLGTTGWYLTEINIDRVTIAKESDKEGVYITPKTLRMGKKGVLSKDAIFTLEDVDISQQVHITILPGEEKITTKTNFMLHIPVEQRLWKLSTEQMNKHIDATQKTIDLLNKAISTVESIYKWWSVGCYATYFIVWMKNSWFSSLVSGGDSLSRKTVMSAYKEECTAELQKEDTKYETLFDCIVDKKESINNDIRGIGDFLADKGLDENEKTKKIAEYLTKNSGNTQLKEKYSEEAFDVILEEYKLEENPNNLEEKQIAIYNAYKKLLKNKASLKKRYGFDDKKFENIGKILAPLSPPEITSLSVSESNIEKIVTTRIKMIKDNEDNEDKKFLFSEDENKIIGRIGTNDQNKEGYRKGNNFQLIEVVSATVEEEAPHIPKVSLLDSGKFKGRIDKLTVDARTYLKVPEDGRDDNGQIIKVEFYERFSTFSSSSDNLPLNSNANRLREFTIDECNRGYSSKDDDRDHLKNLIEQYKNLQIACRDLVKYDREIGLREYKKGDSLGGKYIIDYFAPEMGGLQCFDIMSVDDCLTLFSACDPVMCPTSRFNAGGKWPVDNVVSTGIFGSIFLGSKLWRTSPIPEVGICVPGIDAGLKNTKSLFQGYQECLIARRDDGENFGICDTIRGVGICKILWREGTALFRLSGSALDKIIDVAKGASGGQEYSYFQPNMQKTSEFMKFFTKEYATTYFSAYRGASTDEIGEQLCEAAIYSKVPGVGGFLNQLTTPEGPVQFTAWFTEFPHSALSGEIISDYEVYYHIYAGEDKETVKYMVYLKDVDGFLPNLYVTETTGYLKRGDFVDKTERYQEKTGYDELCILIDNQEHCGFGKVSSGILDDYLQDQALKKEFDRKDISSEEECRGEQSVLSDISVSELADALYPGINRNGLLRICSYENPGNGVDNSNWKKVGNCGVNDEGQSLGDCWLNKKSYMDALSEYDLEKRNEAEELFRNADKNFEKDEKVLKFVRELILERTEKASLWATQMDDFDGKVQEMINGFMGIIRSNEEDNDNFEYWLSKTYNVDLMAKIEYEIGNTYYELASLLDMKDAKDKAKAEAEKIKKEEPETDYMGSIENGFYVLFDFRTTEMITGFENDFERLFLESFKKYGGVIDLSQKIIINVVGYASEENEEQKEVNQQLSEQRANAIAEKIGDVLLENYPDFENYEINVVGKGATQQFNKIESSEEENYKLNRRVEVTFEVEESDLLSGLKDLNFDIVLVNDWNVYGNPIDSKLSFSWDGNEWKIKEDKEGVPLAERNLPLAFMGFPTGLIEGLNQLNLAINEKIGVKSKEELKEIQLFCKGQLISLKTFEELTPDFNFMDWLNEEIYKCSAGEGIQTIDDACTITINTNQKGLLGKLNLFDDSSEEFSIAFYDGKWRWRYNTPYFLNLVKRNKEQESFKPIEEGDLNFEVYDNLNEQKRDRTTIIKYILSFLSKNVNDYNNVINELARLLNEDKTITSISAKKKDYTTKFEYEEGKPVSSGQIRRFCYNINDYLRVNSEQTLLYSDKSYDITVDLMDRDNVNSLNLQVIRMGDEEILAEDSSSKIISLGEVLYGKTITEFDSDQVKFTIYDNYIFPSIKGDFFFPTIWDPGVYYYILNMNNDIENIIIGKFVILKNEELPLTITGDADCEIYVEEYYNTYSGTMGFKFEGRFWEWNYNLNEISQFLLAAIQDYEREEFKIIQEWDKNVGVPGVFKEMLELLIKNKQNYKSFIGELVNFINEEGNLNLRLEKEGFDKLEFKPKTKVQPGTKFIELQEVFDYCNIGEVEEDVYCGLTITNENYYKYVGDDGIINMPSYILCEGGVDENTGLVINTNKPLKISNGGITNSNYALVVINGEFLIEGGRFYNNKEAGLTVDGESAKVTIVGGVFDNNKYGIQFHKGNFIMKNGIINNNLFGISVYNWENIIYDEKPDFDVEINGGKIFDNDDEGGFDVYVSDNDVKIGGGVYIKSGKIYTDKSSDIKIKGNVYGETGEEIVLGKSYKIWTKS